MKFISGNDALAQACKVIGIDRATAYPGTPSTSILESISKNSNVSCAWSVNEKVALEDAAGVYFAGGRAVCIMKSVGLNVASDPLMTLSYTGGFGALVIVVCDDPGAFSSQNEQDNRNYAKFAKMPMLEPSTTEECYWFFKEAVEISERFDTPVLFRMTTRVCTNKTMVSLPPFTMTTPTPQKAFRREQEKLIMTPRQAKIRHTFIEERLDRLQNYNSQSSLNVYTPGSNKDRLIVTSGASYLYVKELFPETSIAKVGFTHPMPIDFLTPLSKAHKEVICVEELDPFMEEQLLISGISNVRRKAKSFYVRDYTLSRVRQLVENNAETQTVPTMPVLPPPPPTLCSGCPHLTIVTLIRDLDLNVCGDIGCYTIGSQNPHYAMHSVLDMGASIPMSTGMSKVLPEKDKRRLAAIIGDSTFFHSGITGLIDAVQNNSNALVFILDNAATAMTGRQGHPGTGTNIQGSAPKVDYVKLIEAIGVKKVTLLDPYDWKAVRDSIDEATKHDEMHVFILRRECALLVKSDVGEKKAITKNCVNCRDCLRIGCPAIYYDPILKGPQIDLKECIGCEICIAVCQFDSIVPLSKAQKDVITQKQEDVKKAEKSK